MQHIVMWRGFLRQKEMQSKIYGNFAFATLFNINQLYFIFFIWPNQDYFYLNHVMKRINIV